MPTAMGISQSSSLPKNFRRIFRTSFVCHISRPTSAPIMVVAAPPTTHEQLDQSEYFCDIQRPSPRPAHSLSSDRRGADADDGPVDLALISRRPATRAD